jgi:hypothetical protein
VGDRKEIGQRGSWCVFGMTESANINLLRKLKLRRSRHRWEDNSKMDFEADGL